MTDSISPSDVDKSSKMFGHFCTRMESLYGRWYKTYNVHVLIHLPECVRNLGTLLCTVVSKTKHSKMKAEEQRTKISKTKHPKLKNKASKSRNHCRLKDYNFKSCMPQAKPGGGNGCVKALQWQRIVVPSSVHKSAKVWTFGHIYFWLIMFQIDHVQSCQWVQPTLVGQKMPIFLFSGAYSKRSYLWICHFCSHEW